MVKVSIVLDTELVILLIEQSVIRKEYIFAKLSHWPHRQGAALPTIRSTPVCEERVQSKTNGLLKVIWLVINSSTEGTSSEIVQMLVAKIIHLMRFFTRALVKM